MTEESELGGFHLIGEFPCLACFVDRAGARVSEIVVVVDVDSGASWRGVVIGIVVRGCSRSGSVEENDHVVGSDVDISSGVIIFIILASCIRFVVVVVVVFRV